MPIIPTLAANAPMDQTLHPSHAEHTGTLAGVPNSPLSAKQQLEALRRLQDQADKRVRLGMDLYRAAEAQTSRHHSLMDDFRADQDRLKQELQEDVARSLQTYDQWVGKIDEDFTNALRNLEGRVDKLQDQWVKSQKRISAMMNRSELLLDQSRVIVKSTAKTLAKVQRGQLRELSSPPRPTPPSNDATAPTENLNIVVKSLAPSQPPPAVVEAPQPAPTVKVEPAMPPPPAEPSPAPEPAADQAPWPMAADKLYQRILEKMDNNK